MPPLDSLIIRVAARRSPLSQVQTREVEQELQQHHPQVCFDPVYLESYGDHDRTTSLRSLDKTDFFTKEIDACVLGGDCRLAIHSAKDLPEPLPEGLCLVCLTRGQDSSDSLVLRQGVSLNDLPAGARIATSSLRREEAVCQLRSDLNFQDIRGTIEERLATLDRGDVDGVVIAEAALIRLDFTSRNRVRLPGETTPLQGQLAVVAREDDTAMKELFAPMTCPIPVIR